MRDKKGTYRVRKTKELIVRMREQSHEVREKEGTEAGLERGCMQGDGTKKVQAEGWDEQVYSDCVRDKERTDRV